MIIIKILLAVLGVMFILFIGLACLFGSMYGAGTLGGFESRTFNVNKYVLERAYRIPEKWNEANDWTARGYDFLDTRIFYFKSNPEEMYYVSFMGDSVDWKVNQYCIISVRSVYNEKDGWRLENNCPFYEDNRIEKRFDEEIIAKLEKGLNIMVMKN